MMPFVVDIDPQIIDLLIEKEKNQQKELYNQPFLELPLDIPPKPSSNEIKDDDNNDDGVIIIDI